MIVRTFLFVLLTAWAGFAQMPPIEPGVSHDLARWRAARYSDVRYKLNLTLEKMSPVLKGRIEIRVKVSGPPASAGGASAIAKPGSIVLDWRKIRGSESLSTVSNVSINGISVSTSLPPAYIACSDSVVAPDGLAKAGTQNAFYESNEHLIFSDGVQEGENVIKLDFTSPILTSGSAITRYVDKEDGAEYIYSLFVPSDASTAFPVFDQPDLKAKFSLSVTSPAAWKVVSNTAVEGMLSSAKVDEGRETVVSDPSVIFAETRPISTYVFAFAAGPWEQVSVPGAVATDRDATGAPATGIYVRKSQAEKFKSHAAEVFRLNREGIKFLETYFDYKFPFPKYDIVLIPEFPFGGMEHAGATFLREDRVIFPQEPTKNDYITRANVIFHEAAHQWFGDTVTMRWFDDLWLKEGFAEFMAYKTLEKVMPEYNAWKVFYERNKQAAYLTDSTKGTTPIYQEIANLSAAKSAYGNIVYRKAPSFLKQAEFYIGPDKFQTAVRAFLKKHEFANAGWEDLVREFEEAELAEAKKGDFFEKLSSGDKKRLEDFTRWSVQEEWAQFWVQKPGTAIYRVSPSIYQDDDLKFEITGGAGHGAHTEINESFLQEGTLKDGNYNWLQNVKIIEVFKGGQRREQTRKIGNRKYAALVDAEMAWVERMRKKNEQTGRKFEPEPWIPEEQEAMSKSWADYVEKRKRESNIVAVLPNYRDYGYGIFLLDDKSRDYVLKNIHTEKDDFLRSMMWGSLWDSVREGELDPKEYVELVLKNLGTEPVVSSTDSSRPVAGKKPAEAGTQNGGETDESTIQTLLGRVATAMNYYMSEPAVNAGGPDLRARVEAMLIDKMENASTPGQRITYYRTFLNTASSPNARRILKEILRKSVPGTVVTGALKAPVNTAPGTAALAMPVSRTKDYFDIVTRLIILGDPEPPQLLVDLEKTETSDEARRYAYAARAGLATAENKAKYWTDFTSNKEISESWIEAAFVPFNSIRHAELTLPYLEKSLGELPNLKRNRKIFFVNGWLAAFIGGQKSEQALGIVNKFLADNPNLDRDLRLKILENVDLIERAVRIRGKYGKS